MFYLSSLALLVALGVLGILSVAAMIIAVFSDVYLFNKIFFTLLCLFIVYVYISDYFFLYFFKVTSLNKGEVVKRVKDRFQFDRKGHDLKVFVSGSSPYFFSAFGKGKNYIILNSEIFNRLEDRELSAFIDYELRYRLSLFSRIESLCNKMYFLFVYPVEALLSMFLPKEVIKYLFSLPREIYQVVVKHCRRNFHYRGKFISFLPQALFKVKIIERKFSRVELLNIGTTKYSMNKSMEQKVPSKRFELEEILE